MKTRFTHTNAEIVEFLGISLSTLKRLRSTSFFRPGKHYIPIGTGSIRFEYRWDPKTTEEAYVLRSRRRAMK
jgi:hypothetical protein